MKQDDLEYLIKAGVANIQLKASGSGDSGSLDSIRYVNAAGDEVQGLKDDVVSFVNSEVAEYAMDQVGGDLDWIEADGGYLEVDITPCPYGFIVNGVVAQYTPAEGSLDLDVFPDLMDAISPSLQDLNAFVHDMLPEETVSFDPLDGVYNDDLFQCAKFVHDTVCAKITFAAPDTLSERFMERLEDVAYAYADAMASFIKSRVTSALAQSEYNFVEYINAEITLGNGKPEQGFTVEASALTVGESSVNTSLYSIKMLRNPAAYAAYAHQTLSSIPGFDWNQVSIDTLDKHCEFLNIAALKDIKKAVALRPEKAMLMIDVNDLDGELFTDGPRMVFAGLLHERPLSEAEMAQALAKGGDLSALAVQLQPLDYDYTAELADKGNVSILQNPHIPLSLPFLTSVIERQRALLVEKVEMKEVLPSNPRFHVATEAFHVCGELMLALTRPDCVTDLLLPGRTQESVQADDLMECLATWKEWGDVLKKRPYRDDSEVLVPYVQLNKVIDRVEAKVRRQIVRILERSSSTTEIQNDSQTEPCVDRAL